MFRRTMAMAIASTFVISALALGASSAAGTEWSAAAADAPEITFPAGASRLSGAGRYDTAVAVSQKYSPGVEAVFVATGQNFPDALSAAAAAASVGGPLLLTPSNALPAAVRAEIVRLAPETIYIAGSQGAVSSAVETSLRGIAPVERLGGASRYDTGNSLIQRIFPRAAQAFIATGRTFPDALAATGAAGSVSAPVILVDGAQPTLTPETLALLGTLGVRSVTIVGGTGAVSPGIEGQLRSTYDTQRIGGAGRYETAANVNDAFFTPGSANAVFLATGQNFPDALAGAALAGHVKSPVYVTTAACVPEAAHLSLQRLAATSTVALGGTAVVSNQAAGNIGCLTAAAPTISGVARVNSALTANTGSWTSGTSFAYQWLANGSPISQATGASLSVSAGLAGKQISVRVTGSKAGYLSASVQSGRTAAVSYPSRTTPIDIKNCPSWAPIKGNVGTKEKIYHVPGGRDYAKTNPEECFRTEAAAVSAGYRKSKV